MADSSLIRAPYKNLKQACEVELFGINGGDSRVSNGGDASRSGNTASLLTSILSNPPISRLTSRKIIEASYNDGVLGVEWVACGSCRPAVFRGHPSLLQQCKRRNDYGLEKRRRNSMTSMAQHEEVIRRTVYVSDIDQQALNELVNEEQLAALSINCGQGSKCI